jgi:lysophospholipid acyltransferase (LPLAT)-like uncharacterized protein
MKKFFKKIIIFLAPYLIYVIINLLKATVKSTHLNSEKIRELHEKNISIIMSFWHGRLLMMATAYLGKDLNAIISIHEDGEMISRAMGMFNIASIRGSTTRGGTKALREMITVQKSGGDIAITPDGPKGPRHIAQNGAIILAKATGAPICPVTFNASRKKQFSSWDGFILPYPFSKGVFIWGDPIFVSKDADKDEIERKRVELEKELKRITQKADSYF